MAYPTSLKPTSRSFDPGDYPIKYFRSQSGKEIRILYGDKRTNMRLALTYSNITDANAQLFVDHYDEVKGSFNTFNVVDGDKPAESVKTGWSGSEATLGATGSGAAYRYESPPQIKQVRPGISTVTVKLIGVL